MLLPNAPMLPGMPPPGMGAPPGLLGGGHDGFSVGLLAGLGLREFSQLFGLSKSNKAQGSSQPSAAALMQGNLGDMDRQMVLAEMLKRQQAAAAPLPGAGLPIGAGMPVAGGLPPQPSPVLPPGTAPGPLDPRMAMMLAARNGSPPLQSAAPPPAGGPVATALLSQLMAKAMQARTGPI